MLILCTACGQEPIHDTTEKANTHDATLTKDSISFGGLSYLWEAVDGKILFYDKAAEDGKDEGNKTPVITMVPVED